MEDWSNEFSVMIDRDNLEEVLLETKARFWEEVLYQIEVVSKIFYWQFQVLLVNSLCTMQLNLDVVYEQEVYEWVMVGNS